MADPNNRQRIAEGIAAPILEEARLGDDGIPPVREIWAPLFSARDARDKPGNEFVGKGPVSDYAEPTSRART